MVLRAGGNHPSEIYTQLLTMKLIINLFVFLAQTAICGCLGWSMIWIAIHLKNFVHSY